MSELTAREKITKYCKIEKQPGRTGDLLLYGHHKYRMNRKLDSLTEAECVKVLKLMELDAYITKHQDAAIKSGHKPAVRLEQKPCECGCGKMARRGSKFRPGHDAKLHSALREAAGGEGEGAKKAREELKARGWA